jgi:RNA polymerase-binding protein DksA
MAKATTKTAARSSSTAKKTPASKAKDTAKSGPPNGLDKFQESQLQALEDERATYLRQAETLQAEADSLTEDREPGDVQFDEESGEGDTLAVERERDLALSAQARAAIEEIDRAITKIHEGSYGRCENCGTAIPKERLKALPYAALCVKCKSGGLGLSR